MITSRDDWSAPAPPRHLVRVDISLVLIAELVREDWRVDHVRVCRGGIPRDAVLVAAYSRPDAACFTLVFEHASFPEVIEGGVVPSQTPMTERVYCRQSGPG